MIIKMGRILKIMLNYKKTKLSLVFVFFSFFSNSILAQNENVSIPSDEVSIVQNKIVIENPVKVSTNTVLNSNVDFILWFMGTKEDFGKNFSDEDIYSKKSILTSGRQPNHLLVKTLLKKTLNNKSC